MLGGARPSTALSGRALPSVVTPAEHRQLTIASTAIRAVERQLLRELSQPDQARLLDDLAACAAAFTGS